MHTRLQAGEERWSPRDVKFAETTVFGANSAIIASLYYLCMRSFRSFAFQPKQTSKRDLRSKRVIGARPLKYLEFQLRASASSLEKPEQDIVYMFCVPLSGGCTILTQ